MRVLRQNIVPVIRFFIKREEPSVMNLTYPVMLKLEGKIAVVIGGGRAGCRKAAELLESGAAVRAISSEFIHSFEDLAGRHGKNLVMVRRPYKDGDLKGACIVFAATSDSGVNRAVYDEGEREGILVNSVDDPESSNFYPAKAQRKK